MSNKYCMLFYEKRNNNIFWDSLVLVICSIATFIISITIYKW